MPTNTLNRAFSTPTASLRHTSTAIRNRIDLNDDIQYRQLVSRAVTQRLHSPSLDEEQANYQEGGDAWEASERKKSRDKAKTQVLLLGKIWEEFVRDVQRTEREVHVLTPTRYEAPMKSGFIERNVNAVKENEKRSFVMPIADREAWQNTQQKHIVLLRSLAQVRGRNCD